jgi:carbamoyl-phosphate synthase small subunit
MTDRSRTSRRISETFMRKPAVLVLADGRVFPGYGFGAEQEAIGEVVFNTSMMGYQEILSDPSYKGQMVAMTYPLIGNYGINYEDVESSKAHVDGFIVREASLYPSNWRSRMSLDQYLVKCKIAGIDGVDTRALTIHLREHGSQMGIISSEIDKIDELTAKVKAAPPIVGRDLVSQVTCKTSYTWNQGDWLLAEGYRTFQRGIANDTAFKRVFKVVAFDFGVKFNILRMLTAAGCDLTVVPASASVEEVLSHNPDGIFLSNGPGDPEGVPYAVETVRELVGKKPIFGICLGHQILGLALGGKTYKLKFGHHGGNQPVMDLTTEKVEITSQNHNFAVDTESLGDQVTLTHINCNDKTVEGLQHNELPIFSVQYHPEASPGPHDSAYLFERFTKMMEKA